MKRFEDIKEICKRLDAELSGKAYTHVGEQMNIVGIHPHYHKDLIIVVLQTHLMSTMKVRFKNEKELRESL